jgi:hypothetical protein
MSRSTTIGLIGPAKSRSTIFCYILGSLPGAIAIGEDHCIRDTTRTKYCADCAGKCPFFTDAFMDQLRANTGRWFTMIGEAAKANFVVSSNKSTWNYDALQLPGVCIILYHDLRAAMASKIAKDKLTTGGSANMRVAPSCGYELVNNCRWMQIINTATGERILADPTAQSVIRQLNAVNYVNAKL